MERQGAWLSCGGLKSKTLKVELLALQWAVAVRSASIFLFFLLLYYLPTCDIFRSMMPFRLECLVCLLVDV